MVTLRGVDSRLVRKEQCQAVESPVTVGQSDRRVGMTSTVRRRFRPRQQQQQNDQHEQWHQGRDQEDETCRSHRQHRETCRASLLPPPPPQSELRPQTTQCGPKSLRDLPDELHLLILQHLSYPDTLSLKLTCHHFHHLITPTHTVVSRVTWLLSRACAGLSIPKTSQVRMHNDAVFVSNPEVRDILRGRMGHRECIASWREWKGGRNRRRWEGCCLDREQGGSGTEGLCGGVVQRDWDDPWTRLVEGRAALELERAGGLPGPGGVGMCFAPSTECRRERVWDGVGFLFAVATAVFACWMAFPSWLLPS